MNTWQVCRQIQYLLRQRAWTGSATKVFHTDSVLITSAPRESALEQLIMPAALIRPMGATSDDEEPDLISQDIAVTIAVAHAGDAFGEYSMVGGQRLGQEESQGRGLLEIEEEVFAAIELVNTDDGVVIQYRATSEVQPQLVQNQYLLFRDYLFRADLTADRYYHPVECLESA